MQKCIPFGFNTLTGSINVFTISGQDHVVLFIRFVLLASILDFITKSLSYRIVLLHLYSLSPPYDAINSLVKLWNSELESKAVNVYYKLSKK